MMRLSAASRTSVIFDRGFLGLRFAPPQALCCRPLRRLLNIFNDGFLGLRCSETPGSSTQKLAELAEPAKYVPQTYRSSYSMPFAFRNLMNSSRNEILA